MPGSHKDQLTFRTCKRVTCCVCAGVAHRPCNVWTVLFKLVNGRGRTAIASLSSKVAMASGGKGQKEVSEDLSKQGTKKDSKGETKREKEESSSEEELVPKELRVTEEEREGTIPESEVANRIARSFTSQPVNPMGRYRPKKRKKRQKKTD